MARPELITEVSRRFGSQVAMVLIEASRSRREVEA